MFPKPDSSSRFVVVAAIDGSAIADDVIDTAASIAERYAGAELHLLHVIEPRIEPESSTALVMSMTDLTEEARRQLDAVEDRGRKIFTGRMSKHLAVGSAAREILQLSEDLRADLLVVGAKRKKTIERWILGSVSDVVTRKAACAVLVARPEAATAHVPEIEPACADCLETQRASGGATLWCAQHDRRREHPRGHVHYQRPERFAVGSMLVRPEQ